MQGRSRICVFLSPQFLFLFFLPSEATRLHQPVVLLSGSQPQTGSSFPFPSPPPHHRLLLSRRSFSFGSCPVFFSPFFSIVIQEPTFLQKVSEMQCQAHTLCAIWISIFVAKQLAKQKRKKQKKKGFHYKGKSLSVMQLSRAARCGRLCWRNTSPPPPRLCMSLAAQTWRFRCIVHRWELIIRFLLLLIFQLVFPPVRCPALLCSDSSLTPSLHLRRLCLPSSLMVIDGTRRLWGFFFFVMNDGYYLSGRKRRQGVCCKWQCTLDGRMMSCGRLSVIFRPHSSLKECVCLCYTTHATVGFLLGSRCDTGHCVAFWKQPVFNLVFLAPLTFPPTKWLWICKSLDNKF